MGTSELMGWRPERVAEFWTMVCERHNMYHRRVEQHRSPPWTADPILSSHYFTNVYRELDRVTRAAIRMVNEPAAVANASSGALRDWVFNAYVFRTFNWPPTYEALGGVQPADAWSVRRVEKVLLARARVGEKLFTGAFMVNATATTFKGPGGKVRLWARRLHQLKTRHLGRIVKRLHEAAKQWVMDPAGAVEAAHTALMQPVGYGGFLAQEVLQDLTYAPAALPFTGDAWVFLGPGAVRGLRELVEGGFASSKTSQLLVRELRDQQVEDRMRAGVSLRGPNLTLWNIEDCLCEYSKYRQAQMGRRLKRNYDPARANSDLSPWARVGAALGA